jgi:hypothetical protein
MNFSDIYTDFSEDINWIRERIQAEINICPDSLKSLAEYYVKNRLLVLSDKTRNVRFDPDLGRPVPYVSFWFAEAFGITNKEITRKLTLGLVYSSIAITIHDDIVDNELLSELSYFALEKMYFRKYLEVFNELFCPDSKFWYYLVDSIKELARYEGWNLTFNYEHSFNPFSKFFLKESSRYFTAVITPTLIALAFISKNERKISMVKKFVKHFSMGWRIYDDLKDWCIDLKVKNFNNSSILIYTLQNVGKRAQLNEEIVQSMFLSTEFINKSYDAMLSYFNLARNDVLSFNCSYLSRFMDEQIRYQTRKRDILLQSSLDFYNQLYNILSR